MHTNSRIDSRPNSRLALIACVVAACVSFALLFTFSGTSLAAPDESSSSSAKATATSEKASPEENAAVEEAAEEETTALADNSNFFLGNDKFLAAETVDTSNDAVKANLFAAGNSLRINQSTVGADVFLAGQSISLTGAKVDNNVFIAGNNITVSGTEAKHVSVAGNNLDIAVDGDSASLAGSTVFLKGTFTGNVDVYAQSVVIDPYLVVNGTLNVTAEEDPEIPSTAKIGSYNFTQAEFDNGFDVAKGFASIGSQAWIEDLVKTLISMLIAVIFMMLFLRTESVDKMGSLVKDRPLAILITGILSAILFPILILALFVTVFGWQVAIVLLAIMMCVTAFCVVYTAVALGRAAFSKVNKWVTSIIFVAIFGVLMSLPVVDFILAILCLVFALGSAVQGWWVWRRNKALRNDEPNDDGAYEFSVPRGNHYAGEPAPATTAQPTYMPSGIPQTPTSPSSTGSFNG